MFHAITGCDTVSAFVGHVKKSAWATWNSLPELTDALLSLANAPTSLQEDTMHVIERFVILLYDRTSKCKDVNKARTRARAPSTNRLGLHRSDDGPYTPLWTTLPEASKTCYELVSCGCKKGYRNRCKCKKASLQCTGLCFCEGECQ